MAAILPGWRHAMHPYAGHGMIDGLTATETAIALARAPVMGTLVDEEGRATHVLHRPTRTLAEDAQLRRERHRLDDPELADPRAVCILQDESSPNMFIDPGACRACGTGPAALRCSACRLAHYCNAACQRQDWSRHKFECRHHRRSV